MSKPSKLDIIWGVNGASVDPGDDKFKLGWEAEIPPYQYFNYYMNKHSQMLDHINTNGLPVWDELTPYAIGALTLYSGIEYRCTLEDSTGSLPTDLEEWALALGDQTTNKADSPTFEDISITGMTGTVESRIEGNASDIDGLETRMDTAEDNIDDAEIAIETLESKVGQELNTDSYVEFGRVEAGSGGIVAPGVYIATGGVVGEGVISATGGIGTTGRIFAQGGYIVGKIHGTGITANTIYDTIVDAGRTGDINLTTGVIIITGSTLTVSSYLVSTSSVTFFGLVGGTPDEVTFTNADSTTYSLSISF